MSREVGVAGCRLERFRARPADWHRVGIEGIPARTSSYWPAPPRDSATIRFAVRSVVIALLLMTSRTSQMRFSLSSTGWSMVMVVAGLFYYRVASSVNSEASRAGQR